MQFGRIHGVALAVLGAILLGVQAMFYLTSPKVPNGTSETSVPTVERKTSPVAGIVGIGSLIAGVAIFATRRRTDEPDAKHAVK